MTRFPQCPWCHGDWHGLPTEVCQGSRNAPYRRRRPLWRRLLHLSAAALLCGWLVASNAAPAGADPICDAPGLPPCAPPAPFTLTPDQYCAVIMWRTWVPCNWWGVQVPEGTPGSVG